jgi:hypothetical protein
MKKKIKLIENKEKTNSKLKYIYFIFAVILLGVFVVATTTIRDTGTSTFTSNVLRLNSDNATLRLVSTQPGERAFIQQYNGSQIMLSIECHGNGDIAHQLNSGVNETHCGFYGSNSIGSTKKVFSVQWGYERNNITFANNPSFGLSQVDFNDIPLWNLNFSMDRINSNIHFFKADPVITIQDSDTSTTTAQPTIQLAESGGSGSIGEYWNITTGNSDFDFVIIGSSIGRVFNIDRTKGEIVIGAGDVQRNITMTSPDGTEFTCGVNNTGSLICT